MILTLLRSWPWAAVALLAAALALGASWLTAKVIKSYEVENLRDQLRVSRGMHDAALRRFAAERVARSVAEAEYNRRIEAALNSVRVVKRDVAKIVPDRRECDLSVDAVRLLNTARGAQ